MDQAMGFGVYTGPGLGCFWLRPPGAMREASLAYAKAPGGGAMDYGDYYWRIYRDYYSLFAEYPRPAKVKRFNYGRIIQTPKGYRLPTQLLR